MELCRRFRFGFRDDAVRHSPERQPYDPVVELLARMIEQGKAGLFTQIVGRSYPHVLTRVTEDHLLRTMSVLF
jgi:hypothetical protein